MQLQAEAAPLVLVDCGFDLFDTAAGERAFVASHLPGAVYAHIDRDLSGPTTGRNGRHPLPDAAAFAATVGRWGVRPGVQVVAYDDQGMSFAPRLWWLLRWLGHDAVAVLDGGRAAWSAAGGALSGEPPKAVTGAPYPGAPGAMPTIDAATLLARLDRVRVIDARAGERFRGEVEPLDPVAGHIPGAAQRFHKDNVGPDGCFKPATELREAFVALGANAPEVVLNCGSGVTASHNLLVMAHAGLGIATLYPGSWSEWCSDPTRPVEVGPSRR